MGSTSTSSIRKSFKYDVFVSFRGEDTRKNFVDHLYYALQQKSIRIYKDDEKIKKGKMISDELIKSIEDSKFYIIVFSKNYASSSWCLDELVKIIECQKTTEQTAYPVFYDVEPTEIRKQSGAVGVAFAKHEKDEPARKWREALKEAADLAGWELKNTDDGHEAKFIQKIVQEISLELRSINSSVDEKLIGMETRVNDVVSSLESGNGDVLMIGIKGMGGGGKTTLARAVFDHISVQFEGKSFVENVREVSNASLYGLNKLQEQVLSNVLNDQSIRVSSVHDGKHMMKNIMRGRKVLVVLDDVDHLDQLEALAGETSWFRPGSRIIITTRDEQVLVAHKVNSIHDVSLLSDNEAVCLFSRYAFGRENPIQGYGELSGQVVSYAAGLPLTIKVLGSSLCGKNDLEWTDAIERLKTIPLKETLEKLELSYIGLEKDHKEIFLDVSCFMIGWEKDRAIRVLESCGFHARNGLRVLEQKSLISFYDGDEYLSMHDHISEMGRNIVRRLHPDEPNRHIRLWNDDEIKDILVNHKGTKATRCIRLCGGKFDPEIIMKGLGNMKQLIFLDVHEGQNPFDFFSGSRRQSDSFSGSSWHFDEVSQYLPNALRFLNWKDYPFRCLPKTFLANNLVRLEMHSNRLEQLWERGERKVLNKLRFLDLRYSKFLKTLDLSLTPNLEMLNLQQCEDLVQLHNPNGLPKLKSLVLDYSKLRYLNLGPTPHLEKLSLKGCCDLVELHIPFRCPKLKFLNLNWSKLRTLNLGRISDLEKISLKGVNLVELHMPNECPKLKSLSLDASKLRYLKLGLTPDLETLSLEGCSDLVELHMPNECPKLKSLSLNSSKLRYIKLGQTPNLEALSLEGCRDLVELHITFRCPNLKSLNLKRSNLRTLDLGMISDFEIISLEGGDLVEVYMPNECPKLKSLSLNCSKLRYIKLGQTPNLEALSLEGCRDLVELHIPFRCPNLKSLNLQRSKLRTLDLGMISDLETLSLKRVDLVELDMPFRCPNLKSLSITYSKLRYLNLGMTPNLKTLNLVQCCDLEELHMPLGCPNLKYLSLRNSKLRTLDLGLTPNVERLDLQNCHDLEEIHAPIGFMKKILYLDLRGCSRFESFVLKSCVEAHEVSSLSELHLIVESLDTCPLHPDSDFFPKFRVKCFYKEYPPSSSRNLEKLISLGLCISPNPNKNFGSFSVSICSLRFIKNFLIEGIIPEVPTEDRNQLQCLTDRICMLQYLSSLKLKCCWHLEKLPESFGQLEYLEELTLSSSKIKNLPDAICMLKHLKTLELKSCWHFEKLPRDLGRLQCLEKLILSECIVLRDIPNSICEIKNLKYIHLPYCLLLEKLPEELGRLKCLEELNIEGTGISHLPQSIFLLQGLCIVGSIWRLKSYGFTSLTQTSEHRGFFCI